MAAITLEDLNKNAKIQNNTLESIEKNTKSMSSSLSAFVKSISGFKGDELEAEREAKPAAAGGSGGGLMGKLADNPLSGLLGRFMPIILGIAGALVASFTELGNDIARTFASVFTFKKLFPDSLSKLGATIAGKVAMVGDFLKKGLYKLLMLGEDGKPIASVAKGMAGAQGAGPVTKFFRSIANIFSKIGDVVKQVPFEQIGKFASALGGILKKVFLPIGLIFTAYDTIKGALAGYEDDGWLGAFTGAIGGLLGSIVGAPLDLLKSIVSWVLKKFGFENASESLDSFNIQEEIVRFFKFIPKALGAATDWIGEKFSNISDFLGEIDMGKIFSDLGDTLFFAIQDASHYIRTKFSEGVQAIVNFDPQEGLKALFRSILPDPVKSPIKAALTPDALYEFAGMDPSTGEVLADKAAQASKEGDIAAEFEALNYGDESQMATTEADVARINAQRLRTGQLTGIDESASDVTLSRAAQRKAAVMASSGASVQAAELATQADEFSNIGRNAAAPVVIQDNSSKVQGGSSSQGVVMKSTPVDDSDPFMAAGFS